MFARRPRSRLFYNAKGHSRYYQLFFQHIEALSSSPSVVAQEMIAKSKDTAVILTYTLKDE